MSKKVYKDITENIKIPEKILSPDSSSNSKVMYLEWWIFDQDFEFFTQLVNRINQYTKDLGYSKVSIETLSFGDCDSELHLLGTRKENDKERDGRLRRAKKKQEQKKTDAAAARLLRQKKYEELKKEFE